MTRISRVLLGIGLATGITFCGEIAGAVQTTDGKPVDGALVVINIEMSGPDTRPYSLVLKTGADGTFRATGVPAGTFTVCPQLGGSDLLSPCTWEPARPTVTLAEGETVTMKPFELKQGVHVKLRLDDAAGRLAMVAGKAPRGQVFAGVRAANGFVFPMLVKPNGAGQDHDAVIPYDTDVEVHVLGGTSI